MAQTSTSRRNTAVMSSVLGQDKDNVKDMEEERGKEGSSGSGSQLVASTLSDDETSTKSSSGEAIFMEFWNLPGKQLSTSAPRNRWDLE